MYVWPVKNIPGNSAISTPTCKKILIAALFLIVPGF